MVQKYDTVSVGYQREHVDRIRFREGKHTSALMRKEAKRAGSVLYISDEFIPSPFRTADPAPWKEIPGAVDIEQFVMRRVCKKHS